MTPLLEMSFHETVKVRIHGLSGRTSSPKLVEEFEIAEATDAIERHKVFRIEVRTALAELIHKRILIRELSMEEILAYREAEPLS
ncbi:MULTISPECIES: hypothetical protein [Acidobacteriaceae]|uniref:hypothetical protein n=1 Tax=Acidobacteriaceae TaxID=204434 RepID=UPI00131C6598|nr:MULTISPECIES: hypothetical protein [Acidobacteriaceae]MDW5264574.1 hypothetical protein [Edaphobacter sp.]